MAASEVPIGLFGAAQTEAFVAQGWWIGKTVYQLLIEAAARTPGKTALVDGSHRLTYADVVEATHRIVTVLRDFRISAGDIVAVQLPNWRQFPLIEYALAAK